MLPANIKHSFQRRTWIERQQVDQYLDIATDAEMEDNVQKSLLRMVGGSMYDIHRICLHFLGLVIP